MNKSGQENRSVRHTMLRPRDGMLRLMEEKPTSGVSVTSPA